MRVLESAKPAINPLTEVEYPNSIMHLVPFLNREFGGFSDEGLIFEMAKIVPDENSADRRRATIELVGDVWEKSGATKAQLVRIRGLFRNFFLRAQVRGINVDATYTIGQLRQHCKDNKIRTIPGLGIMAEEFLAQIVARRTLQVLQGGPVVQE